MRDPDKYRTIEINKMMWRVFKGESCVGQVRRGMDGLWYPEVGQGQRTRAGAVQLVVLSNEAIEQFEADVHGCA